jgi:hypothetical protein
MFGDKKVPSGRYPTKYVPRAAGKAKRQKSTNCVLKSIISAFARTEGKVCYTCWLQQNQSSFADRKYLGSGDVICGET